METDREKITRWTPRARSDFPEIFFCWGCGHHRASHDESGACPRAVALEILRVSQKHRSVYTARHSPRPHNDEVTNASYNIEDFEKLLGRSLDVPDGELWPSVHVYYDELTEVP